MDDKIKELLLEAITGESLARNKYTYFADKAKEEGYTDISRIFTLTADNEKEHALIWFKYLGLLGTTEENLKKAAEGEEYEHQDMYPRLSQKAKEYGDLRLSKLFDLVGKIESDHAMRYRTLLKDVANGEVFRKEESQKWICTKCGHVHEGLSAPTVCIVCSNKQADFAIKKE